MRYSGSVERPGAQTGKGDVSMGITYRRGRVPRDVRFAVVTVLAAVVVAAVFSFFGIIGVGMFGWKLALLALAVFAVGYLVDIFRTLYPQLPQVTANAQDEDGRRIYEAVKAACELARVPMPRVYLDPDEEPNAFTYGFGPRHSVIVFQKGIIALAADDEAMLRAVAAHEVGHMLSFDCAIFTALIFPIHVMTWGAHLLQVLARALSGLVRPIVYIARFSGDIWGFLIGLAIAFMVLGAVFYLFMGGVFILAAVALCMLFVNLLKREREYAADAIGARLTGDRSGFVELLRRLLDVSPEEKDVLTGALAGSPGPRPEGDELPDLHRWPRDRYVRIGLRNAMRELSLDHPYVVRRVGNLNSADRLGQPRVRNGDMTAWVVAGLLVVLAPFGVAHGMISGQPRSRKAQRSRSRWSEPTSEPRQATGMRGRPPRSQQQEPYRVQKPEQPRFHLPMETEPNRRQSPRRSAPEAAPPREAETPRFTQSAQPPVPAPPPPPPKSKVMLALEKVSERPEVAGCVEKLWQPDSEVSLVYASFEPGLSYSEMKKIVCIMVTQAQEAAGSDELCLVAEQRSREIMRGQWRSVSGKVIIADLR